MHMYIPSIFYQYVSFTVYFVTICLISVCIYIQLYHTILYHTILYYIILYHNVHICIQVLYISPERLCTASFKRLIVTLQYAWKGHNYDPSNTLYKEPVSLLCVDEAHCISSWSYDFRSVVGLWTLPHIPL